jgi:ubiquinone biosynthesis protein
MHPITRLRRTGTVARLAATLYLIYKVPAWKRKLFRQPKATDEELQPTHRVAAKRILAAALSMRGVIIKMCQAIATRADIFPPEFVERLKECHDRVPSKPFAVVKAAVEREMGKPLEAIFAEFDETPIAAASLAQVHGARLLDGTEVAVKVQYPDIDDIVHTDLRNMERACRISEWVDPQPLELLPLLRELTVHLSYELDF